MTHTIIMPGTRFFRAQHFNEAITEFKKANDSRSRLPLFLSYLMTGDYAKAIKVFPIAGPVAILFLVAGFLSGSLFLLKKSFKLDDREYPNLIFSVAWTLLYFESNAACMLAGPVFGVGLGNALIAGSLLAPIPLLIATALAFRRQRWGQVFQLSAQISWKNFWMGSVGLLLVQLLSGCVMMVLKNLLQKDISQPHNLQLIQEMVQAHPILGLMAIVFAAPLAEEILFRGLLYGALRRWMSESSTILITSLLFAAIHLDLLYFIPLFCLGMVFGWIRQRTGSIWLSFVLHTINNGFSIAMLLIQETSIHH